MAVLGAWFIMQHYRHQAHSHIDEKLLKYGSQRRILVSLMLMMFLSPCFEINAYFLNAGAIGWYAVLTIVVIYNVLTLSGMMLMVSLGRKGIKSINIHWLEHNEQLITGLTLIGLAILNFIVEI